MRDSSKRISGMVKCLMENLTSYNSLLFKKPKWPYCCTEKCDSSESNKGHTKVFNRKPY